MISKWLAVGIILLFVALAINPITGSLNNRDDTTPPVTTISFNPPDPNGENGWYVTPVTVTLNATDNESEVNITKYRIYNSFWMNYTEPFTLYHDGNDIKIEFFSIDAAGNTELVKNTTVDIDRTVPEVCMNYTWVGNRWIGFILIFYPSAFDIMSGMNRVEFYLNGELYNSSFEPGPNYEFSYPLYYKGAYNIRGFIFNPKITDNYVKFYALLVGISAKENLLHSFVAKAFAYDNAGNWDYAEIIPYSFPASIAPGPYLLEGIILPNNYTGRIGMFFIDATFYDTWGGTQ